MSFYPIEHRPIRSYSHLRAYGAPVGKPWTVLNTGSLAVVAILVCTALILVNAVYVAAEFASIGVRRARIQQMAAEGHPLARWLLPVLQTPASLDRYISSTCRPSSN